MFQFSKVPVSIQKRSGFSKSFKNFFTTKVGVITPMLVDEVIPNSTVNLKIDLSAKLPPLASDTYLNTEVKIEAFFVPHRILSPNWENWIQNRSVSYGSQSRVPQGIPILAYPNKSTNKTFVTAPGELPAFVDSVKAFGTGTLFDYLGCPIDENPTDEGGYDINGLPLFAYHKIYDDWYRNPNIQKSCFDYTPVVASSDGGATYLRSRSFINNPIPYYSTDLKIFLQNTQEADSKNCLQLADGHSLVSLRSRNFGYDYFTSCFATPQYGSPQSVKIESPSTNDAKFTISALRAANSLQIFAERNQIAGDKYVDFVKTQYGAKLNYGVAQRSVLLGSASFSMGVNGVYQTTPSSQNTLDSNNPFNTIGSRYGSAYASGSDFIIKNFTADEFGYIMVMFTLVPRVSYSTSLDKMFVRYIGNGSQTDAANPLLQNVGNEPVYAFELAGFRNSWSDYVFGYNERFASWKIKNDQVHGLFRHDSSLRSFVPQRYVVSDGTYIDNDFLKIMPSYYDDNTAASDTISMYGVMVDSILNYNVVMPLAEFSIPSLEDPAREHGNVIMVNRGGKSL